MSCNYADGLSPYQHKGKLGLAETRITVAFTANADGSHKLKPFFIGHVQRPRCFQQNTGDQLGFYYRFNKKAWMTGVLFQEWLLALENEMKVFDSETTVLEKTEKLADWIRNAKHVVVHTGAGISTSAGIPDFRGPSGVWTLESKGQKPSMNISFDEAQPTKTHMALVALYKSGFVHHVVTQNVDGLHLKSGFPRSCYSELHGNMFIEQCAHCERQFVRSHSAPTVGQKCLDKPCPVKKPGGRACRGKLHDTILDWEAELPYKDLDTATLHSRQADLSLCLGSTLQIIPSGNLPLQSKKNKGKLVICNLQPTKHDNRADLIIHSYVDSIMEHLCKCLGVTICDYSKQCDPTFMAATQEESKGRSLIEWTLPDSAETLPNKTKSKTARKRKCEKYCDNIVESKPKIELVVNKDFIKEELCIDEQTETTEAS